MDQVISMVVAVAVAVGAFVIFFAGINILASRLSGKWEQRVRPWVFVGPALLFLFIGVVVPGIRTIYLSFREGPRGDGSLTLAHYSDTLTDNDIINFDDAGSILTSRLFIVGIVLFVVGLFIARRSAQRGQGSGNGRLDLTSPPATILLVVAIIAGLFAIFTTLRGVLWNNLWWVVAVTGLSVVIGLALAVLADRSRSETAAKTLIFMPMAISMVGAAVIWSFVYNLPIRGQSPGLLNEVITWFGMEPVDFLRSGSIQPWNSFFIMVIMIWIQTGFAMVVFSSAIKAVPGELIEAAKVDGANDVQVFWRITLPQIVPTVLVVVTTLTVTVLKVFDLVKATTNGNFDTDVLANQMYNNLRNGNFTLSSTFATLILVLVLPVMWFNFRRAREEARR